MTDAEATIRSSILDALLEIPETAKVISPEGVPEKVVTTVLDSIFASPVRWTVKVYAEELDIKFRLQQQAREAEYEKRRRERFEELGCGE